MHVDVALLPEELIAAQIMVVMPKVKEYAAGWRLAKYGIQTSGSTDFTCNGSRRFQLRCLELSLP